MATRSIYFFGNEVNRVINKENVKNLYYSIKQWGFLPDIGKIKKVEVPLNTDIYEVTVTKDKNSDPISINNWTYKLTKVEGEALVNAKAIGDGQHKAIAALILEMEAEEAKRNNSEVPSDFTYKEDDYEEVIEIPSNMDITRFINLFNTGRAWVNKDYKGKLTTGNKYIDRMEFIIQEKELVSDFVYSLYTMGTANINDSTVKALKNCRTDKMPKRLELNDTTQEDGDKLVKAFEDSAMSKEAYNNGKLGKGLKQFAKDYSLDTDTLVRVINAMSKDVWYAGKKPAGSAEASNYAENFKKWYESINK